MPTALKKPSRFPGMDMLPQPIQTLAELVFPQEPELPTPVGTIGYKAAAKKFRPVIKALKEIIKTPQTLGPLERLGGERITDVFPSAPAQVEIPRFAQGVVDFPQGMSRVVKRPPALNEQYVLKRLFHTAVEPKPIGQVEVPVIRGSEELFGLVTEPQKQAVQKPLLGRWQHGTEAATAMRRKLDPESVREIRIMGQTRDPVDIAKKFGVNDATIRDILRGGAWSRVK